MATTPTSLSGVQYSGIWNLNSQAGAKSAGTWPVGSPQNLYAWGDANGGALGTGNQTNRSSPTLVGSTDQWSQIDSSRFSNISTFSIKRNGTLWGWSNNFYGSQGDGTTAGRSSPVQVGSSKWNFVAPATYSTYAILYDGSLWSWGYNPQGQLGLNNTTYYSSPKQIGALTNWAKVSSMVTAVAAIKTDGTLWTWGYNFNGQLGQGNTISRSSPTQVGSLTNWSDVVMSNFCLAVKTDGTLWTWGRNNEGQLGDGTTTSRSSPVQVGSLTTWAKVNIGENSSFAITTNGALYSWGYNVAGQLGLNDTTSRSSPVQVGVLTDWSTVSSASNSHSIALKNNGTLWSWGNNDAGQLGLGNTTNYQSPKQVGLLTTWLAATAGYRCSFGILSA